MTMTRLQRQIIRTDGTVELLPAPLTVRQLADTIGATTLDTVNLRSMGRPLLVMLVDDRGYDVTEVKHGPGHTELVPTKALKPVNEAATALYRAQCSQGSTHQIVGDVAVVPDSDFGDDGGPF